jgi:hypothetical protein
MYETQLSSSLWLRYYDVTSTPTAPAPLPPPRPKMSFWAIHFHSNKKEYKFLFF